MEISKQPRYQRLAISKEQAGNLVHAGGCSSAQNSRQNQCEDEEQSMFARKAAGRRLQVLSFLNRAVCTAAAAALIALGSAAPGRAAGETAEFSALPKPAAKRRKPQAPKVLRSSRPAGYICTPSGFGQTSRCYRRG